MPSRKRHLFDLRRRKISRALSGIVLQVVIQRLNVASKEFNHLKVTKGGPNQAEVTLIYNGEVVKGMLSTWTIICTCREWQMSGLPCHHELAMISTAKQPNMAKYVDIAYFVPKYEASFTGLIPNITYKSQSAQVPYLAKRSEKVLLRCCIER